MGWSDYEYGSLGGASRNFTPYVQHDKARESTLALVKCITNSTKTIEEISRELGTTVDATRKRIQKARSGGYNIQKADGHTYTLSSAERTCKKCGKRLAKLNRSNVCFNYPDCGSRA